MSDTATTPFSKRVEILADLWLEYRAEEAFQELFEYGDLAFPLAFAVSQGIVSPTELVEVYVDEVWGLLLTTLEVDDEGADLQDLSHLFTIAGRLD
jgi:hypothetical protein